MCATFETVGEKTSFFLFPDTFVSIVSISRFHYEKKLKTECVFRDLAAAMDNKKENAFLYLMEETDLHKSLLPWWLTRRSLTVQVSSALQISTYILDINKSSIFLVRGRIGLLLHLHVLFAPMAHTRTHTHTLTPAANSLP